MAWQHFTMSEFACKHCGANNIDESFVDKLDLLRARFGRPLIVTSGYRCPEHNARVSTTGRTGPHTTGRAVDLRVDRKDSYLLLRLAFQMHFTGIGVQQKGPARFIHLDDLPDGPGQPRPTTWS